MSSEQLAADIRKRLGPHNDDALPVVHCVDALRARVEALEASLKELLEIAQADYEFRGVDTSFIDRARALLEQKP
jgi:hypothetical protein